MGSNLKSDIKNTHNWQWTTLGDVAEFINGDRGKNYPSSLDRVEKGIPFINTGHIEPTGRLSDIRMEYITREKYDKLGSGKVQPGDIVYCLRGSTIGKTAINSYSEGAIASSLIIIRAKDNICQGYLYYFLTSPVGQGLATINDNGSAQPNLSGRVLASYPLQIPNYQTQVSITKLLSGLDKKIHLNNETNETLEQMAQALFKSWFVDFDPVFDNLLASADFKLENLENRLPDELKQKAQRRLAALNSLHNAAEIKTSLSALAHELQAQRPTKEVTKYATQSAVQVSEKAAETPVKPNFNANPKILAQHANTHAHFPNEFEHNEQLGWIPKGWEGGCLEDMLVLQRGFDLPKSKRTNGNYPLIVSSGQDGTHSEFKAKGPGVVTGRSGKIGIITFVHDDFWPLNTTLWIKEYRKSNPYHAFHLLSTLGLEQFNSGSAVPTLNRNHIHSLPLVVPTLLVLNEYESYVEGLFLKIRKNNNQSKTLKNLRDTLLPKLISGELQIPDVALMKK